jgi:exosome complex RNA-binding protein Rrp42 (RNase PH superfamily)
LKALCIAAGHVAWRLSLRVLILAADGGEVLAASLGARAALAHARIPKATVSGGGGEGGGGGEDGAPPPEVEVDDDLRAATRLDASRVPALMTLAACEWAGGGGSSTATHIAVDPTAAEAGASAAGAVVAVDLSGGVRAAVLGGRGGLSPPALAAAFAAARQAGPPLLRGVDEAVAMAEAAEKRKGAVGRVE